MLRPYIIIPSFAFFLLASCVNDPEKIELITAKDTLPIETAHNMEVLFSDSALLKMRLNAPLMKRYGGDKPYLLMPEGIDVKFYAGDMRVETSLTARHAISYEQDKIMEARNDVVVINEKGDKLNTELLIWDERKEQIYTSEFVRITTADEVIFGEGLEANQTFTKYKITNIKGTINVKNE